MSTRQVVIVIAVIALTAALVTVLVAPRFMPGLRAPAPPVPGTLPSLARAGPWWRSAPLTDDSLRHRPVVLVLWSDTDPRGLAALQVADAWQRGYAPLGARIVAVHEPEFAYAADSAVAGDLGRRLRLVVPVADDPSNFIEGALGGPMDGPHVVVADETGRVVVDTVGDLAAADRALRDCLRRSCPGETLPPAIDTALPAHVRTVHLGAGKVEGGPLAGFSAGHEHVFTAEFRYQEQGEPWVPFPVGAWRSGPDGITAVRGGAANFVAIRYSAGRAGVVVTPPRGASARLWILRDDRWPRPDERDDDAVTGDRDGVYVLVTAPRLFWIDRGSGEHVLKLSPETPGTTVNAFVFTDTHGSR